MLNLTDPSFCMNAVIILYRYGLNTRHNSKHFSFPDYFSYLVCQHQGCIQMGPDSSGSTVATHTNERIHYIPTMFTNILSGTSTQLNLQVSELLTCRSDQSGVYVTENPAYISMQFAQCTLLLVPQVRNYESPDIVIYVKEPFFCYCCLGWLAASYKGERSLHFDLPIVCTATVPLLRAIIKVPMRGLSRYGYIRQNYER